MSTVTALAVIHDTVVEETFTAERITHQRFADGSVQIRLWTAGRVTEYVSYRQCDKVHVVIGEVAG